MNINEKILLQNLDILSIPKIKTNYVVLDYMDDCFNSFKRLPSKEVIKEDEIFKIGTLLDVDI